MKKFLIRLGNNNKKKKNFFSLLPPKREGVEKGKAGKRRGGEEGRISGGPGNLKKKKTTYITRPTPTIIATPAEARQNALQVARRTTSAPDGSAAIPARVRTSHNTMNKCVAMPLS
ncbi:hypothetical protein BLX88_23775, partial [Bacillus obstructivus]